jgi:PIN like domain
LRSRSEPPPKFFLDRGLGAYSIAGALRNAGIEVQTLRDRYGEEEGQKTNDEKWIEEAAHDGYVLLHKDKRIRYRTIERRALISAQARSFALSSGNLSGADASARLLRNWPKIIRAIRQRPAPFFYVVFDDRIEPRRLDP